jgi:hypothetical protein
MTLLCLLAAATIAPAAHAAGSIGLAEWEAGTCNGSENEATAETEVTKKSKCSYAPEDPAADFYTQSAGHPPWGLTGFKLTQSGKEPTGSAIKRIRVDVPPGLAADPQALETCERSTFEAEAKLCPAGSHAGFVELKAYLELSKVFPLLPDEVLTLKGKVYNLPQQPGHPLMFGIDVEGVPPLVKDVHLLLEGFVSWGPEGSLAARGIQSGDFHEWFQIDNVPPEVEVEPLGLKLASAPLKTVESKLFFNGRAGKEGKHNFLTMPSSCAAPSTSYLELETYAPTERLSQATTPPVKVEHCDKVPFEPTATLTPENPRYDTPDGALTDVRVPQKEKATEINTSDIADAHVTLPEGLTLNPSAAHGLEACTQAQLGKGTRNAVACPAGSKIGTVEIETDLPPHSLVGSVYLGKKTGQAAITAPPYLIFIDAESQYDVSLRLEGLAAPNPVTGRVEVSFLGNPQLPFSDLLLKINGGPRSPLANGMTCGTATTNSLFTPYTGGSPFAPATPFATTGCPNPVPFALGQSTSETSNKAGAFTNFTFNLSRADGNQNISSVQTVLPAGLVGLIPSVKLCPEPAASQGSCPADSAIGKATAAAGVGTEPFSFSGPVYLTGPTNGAPYGLSIPIEAAAGPFDLGRVLTRVSIGVDEHTGRVIATAILPRIVGGVPLHLRSLAVEVNKPNFLFNPTNCSPLSTDSVIGAIQGAAAHPSSPFGVTACTSLPFKPSFTASSPSKPSRANGAALVVGFTQPDHQANIRSVVASLPKELPSRLTTLQKACTEQVWAGGANYKSCPAGSKVGSATVTTPVLPEKLTGPAYLVSHGGANFPDLDLILEGDHGVRVLLEGNTNIKKGITTSTFAAVPDVPVSKFELNLPTGPNSALGNVGGLCSKPLYMPTTITAQSGAVIKQNTRLSIGSCKIKLISKKVRGHKLIIRAQVFTAGRVSVTSPGLHTTYKKVGGPKIVTIKVPISNRGRRTLASGNQLHVKVRVGFSPLHKGEYRSAAFAKVTFRH